MARHAHGETSAKRQVAYPRIGGPVESVSLVQQTADRDGQGGTRAPRKSATQAGAQRFASGRHELVRDVEAASVPVFDHVSTHVRQLHGHTQVRRAAERPLAAHAEHVAEHQADDTGDAKAIAMELGERRIGRIEHVHLHAVEERVRIRSRHSSLEEHALELAKERRILAAPGINRIELGAEHGEPGGLSFASPAVDGVVCSPAPSVERRDAVPLLPVEQLRGEREAP